MEGDTRHSFARLSQVEARRALHDADWAAYRLRSLCDFWITHDVPAERSRYLEVDGAWPGICRVLRQLGVPVELFDGTISLAVNAGTDFEAARIVLPTSVVTAAAHLQGAPITAAVAALSLVHVHAGDAGRTRRTAAQEYRYRRQVAESGNDLARFFTAAAAARDAVVSAVA